MFAGCGPDVVGSRYVKSQNVKANEGALITVSREENERLAGTRLSIPAGALDRDTTVTLELGVINLASADVALSPTAVFGPEDAVLLQDVTLIQPVQGLAADEDFTVLASKANVDQAQVTTDSARSQVQFQTRSFGGFQVLRGSAPVDAGPRVCGGPSNLTCPAHMSCLVNQIGGCSPGTCFGVCVVTQRPPDGGVAPRPDAGPVTPVVTDGGSITNPIGRDGGGIINPIGSADGGPRNPIGRDGGFIGIVVDGGN